VSTYCFDWFEILSGRSAGLEDGVFSCDGWAGGAVGGLRGHGYWVAVLLDGQA